MSEVTLHVQGDELRPLLEGHPGVREGRRRSRRTRLQQAPPSAPSWDAEQSRVRGSLQARSAEVLGALEQHWQVSRSELGRGQLAGRGRGGGRGLRARTVVSAAL
jgi:hypothetical protein